MKQLLMPIICIVLIAVFFFVLTVVFNFAQGTL